MNCLLLSGSVRKGSITVKFLDIVANHFSNITFGRFSLDRLPLFHPDAYDEQISNEVHAFKKEIGKADIVLIATPEYIHNIPAVLKSALEWTTKTGELKNKKVIPIVFTPYAPRGEKAMVSLLQSLKALESKVTTSVLIHHDILNSNRGLTNDGIELFENIWELYFE